MKKKLVLMTSALMAIGLLAGCGQNAHSHEWGDVSYTWAEDNSTCTATRVCKGDESHKETETVDTTSVVVTEAKCEEDGLKRYTADFKTNEAFLDQTKDVTLEAIGHEWGTPTYTWSDDYSSCTATRVCKNDSNHIESETADSAYTEIIPATCDTDGSAVYDAAFENEAFEVQSHEVTLPANHNWGTPTYTWAEDNSTCTARRVCANDPTHIEEETATAVEYVTISPTCTADGEATLIVSFENKAFENQAKEHIPVKTTGHHYIFDSFVWADDYSSAQAKYVCFKDSSHILLYNATVTSEVVTDPTCEEEGVKEYYAIYEDRKNTVEVKIPALGHKLAHVDAKEPKCAEDGNVEHWHCTVCEKNYSDSEGKNLLDNVVVPSKGHTVESVTYEWSADHKTCTAKGTCSVCHKQATETVNTAEGELESTDCYLYGLVASFKTKGFEPQIYDYYKFTLNDDKASYTVFPGDHLPSNVVIPGEVNKLPVTIIGANAFYDKDNITSIFIPKTVVVIDRWAISYNDGITSIVFEEGSALERIESTGIAANYGLTTLTLPASLKYIGGIDGNVDLTNIYFLGTMEQWRAIEKGYDWNWYTPGCGAIHCIDGDVDDHYVDDDPDDWDDEDDDDDWYD